MSAPGSCPLVADVIKNRMIAMRIKSLEELAKRFEEPERIIKSLPFWAAGNYPPGGKNRDELCEILCVPKDLFEQAGHNVYNHTEGRKNKVTAPVENRK